MPDFGIVAADRIAAHGAGWTEGADQVDAAMAWVVDRARIRELTARYNRCFDDGDPEGFAANFTEDGAMVVEGGPTTTGRAALAEMVRRTPYGIVHVTVDAIVEVDGDRAVQDVTLLVLARPGPDAPPDKRRSRLQNTGRYHDELVRTAEGWRFARRTVTLDGGL
ncbi:MAG: nuclear transport factor 2 family protein [Acidimicrobiales bacterium]